jgi:hypothetical protein
MKKLNYFLVQRNMGVKQRTVPMFPHVSHALQSHLPPSVVAVSYLCDTFFVLWDKISGIRMGLMAGHGTFKL